MLISKSSSAKDSIENWYKHISKTKSPRKLTRILLSDRPFKDKANLLVALPVSATEQNTDMRWLESKFEDTGHAQLAQIVRWRLFWYLSEDQRKRILKWSHKSVVADIQRRAGLSSERYIFKRNSELYIKHRHFPTPKTTMWLWKGPTPHIIKNFDNWKISYGIFPDGAENWRQTCLLVVFKGPLGHTERIQTGISAHGYAKIMLDVVAVVDEIVDAAKSPEQEQHYYYYHHYHHHHYYYYYTSQMGSRPLHQCLLWLLH